MAPEWLILNNLLQNVDKYNENGKLPKPVFTEKQVIKICVIWLLAIALAFPFMMSLKATKPSLACKIDCETRVPEQECGEPEPEEEEYV